MKCNLCPRRCGALRTPEQPGYCQSPWQLTAARASLHMWEEPVISGVLGSGTVFFSGCGLGCVFCQNRSIAKAEVSKELSGEKLSEIFLNLQEKGAHNINLVTGSHYVPQLAKALRLAKDRGLTIPVVYNTGSYEKTQTLRLLEGLVDIYLPDLKFFSPRLAGRYANAADYYPVAMKAIKEMVRQVGEPRLEALDVKKCISFARERGQEISGYFEEAAKSEEGETEDTPMLMKKGVIVRHLMLPGQLADSKKIVRGLYNTFGDSVYLSLMNQYTPCNELPEYPELADTVSAKDYEKLIDYAIDLGVENGFIQEGETNLESFIPSFDYSGLS